MSDTIPQPSLFDEASDGPECCPTCHRPFLSDTGKVGRKHPETSRAAAAMPGKRSEAVRALKVLASHGPMNAGTLAPYVGKSPNQTATRFGELREAGLIERLTRDGVVVTADTPLGGRGEVHKISTAGITYLASLR